MACREAQNLKIVIKMNNINNQNNENNQNNQNNFDKEKMEEELIGKTIDEAKELYPEYVFRPSMIDGKLQMLTMDYRMDRVNVFIDNGVISGIGKLG